MSKFQSTDQSSVQFTENLQSHFQKLSDEILGALSPQEELTLNLNAESTLFVRFNGNKVRQNTDVEQMHLSATYHNDSRTVDHTRSLTGRWDTDLANMRALLETCREEARALPPDPNQVPVANNGTSRENFRGQLLTPENLVEAIVGPANGSDLAGLYSGGQIIRANRNSKGQDHWFATETYFMDYSLYDGPRAAKSVYAGAAWNQDAWETNLSRARQQLSLLSRPTVDVKPGQHRCYLAPGAVSELVSILSWGAYSASAWKRGLCAFKRLIEGEAKLSPHFSLRENFSTGLAPRFNSLGEVAPETLSIVEKGELKNLLVSSRSAKEYGLVSNAASEWEGVRAPEILPGSIDERDILKELGTGLYLSNLHYLNWSDMTAARITGMTRYACFWVENGEIQGPIKDLRFDETLFDAFGAKLMGLTKHSEIDPSVQTYGSRELGGRKVPGMLIDGFKFTL